MLVGKSGHRTASAAAVSGARRSNNVSSFKQCQIKVGGTCTMPMQMKWSLNKQNCHVIRNECTLFGMVYEH